MKPLILLASLVVMSCVADFLMPLIGYHRDRAGALRQVYGVSGAFVTGESLARDVLSVAWSGSSGFAKTSNELLLLDQNGITGRQPAPPGPATFGFDQEGRRAWVQFADGSCSNFGSDCPTEAPHKPLLRIRMPEPVQEYDQLGERWLLGRGASRLYVIRTAPDTDHVYELPEARP